MLLFPQFFQYLSLVASSLSLFILTVVASLNTLLEGLESFIITLPFNEILVNLEEFTNAPSPILFTFGIFTDVKAVAPRKTLLYIVTGAVIFTLLNAAESLKASCSIFKYVLSPLFLTTLNSVNVEILLKAPFPISCNLGKEAVFNLEPLKADSPIYFTTGKGASVIPVSLKAYLPIVVISPAKLTLVKPLHIDKN